MRAYKASLSAVPVRAWSNRTEYYEVVVGAADLVTAATRVRTWARRERLKKIDVTSLEKVAENYA